MLGSSLLLDHLKEFNFRNKRCEVAQKVILALKRFAEKTSGSSKTFWKVIRRLLLQSLFLWLSLGSYVGLAPPEVIWSARFYQLLSTFQLFQEFKPSFYSTRQISQVFQLVGLVTSWSLIRWDPRPVCLIICRAQLGRWTESTWRWAYAYAKWYIGQKLEKVADNRFYVALYLYVEK